MFSWVKSFFTSADRVTVAGERAAKAAEEIAEMIEQTRDQFRARLSIDAAPAPVVALPAVKGDEPEPAGAKKKR